MGDYKGRVGDIPLKGTLAPIWEWGYSKTEDFLAAADNPSKQKNRVQKNYDFTALLSTECQLRIQINAINFEFFTHSCATRFPCSEDKKK